jgi:hypothetical protein
MQVVAFSTPGRPDWHWRIVSYSGDTMEESHEAFGTIAAAIANGSRRLEQMNVPDRAVRLRPFRSAALSRSARGVRR